MKREIQESLSAAVADVAELTPTSVTTNPRDALVAMTVLKEYGKLCVDVLYTDPGQWERNIRTLYATLLRLEPMAVWDRDEEVLPRTDHVRDVALCMAPMVCIPIAAFPDEDSNDVRNLRNAAFRTVKILVETSQPDAGDQGDETGSFGDLRLSRMLVRRMETQLVMDGDKINPDPRKQGTSVLSTVRAEFSSLVESLFNRFQMNYKAIDHPLPRVEGDADGAWNAFEKTVEEDPHSSSLNSSRS